ncbi:hypothetical protein QR680_010471 [Steinernema hermaphroditum]|uniref:Uncharacterized protein n=1 Tax=Steinernema hermaphroditum TaxID=289476 RepID=A0AA39IP44_9BILA|nr:hypothetical protein QR680_010471 [Steinernema hermaphroditum]
MSPLQAVVFFVLLASAISALPYYDPLYAPRGAPVAAYRPRLPYNYGMYLAYPQYYYNYFYGHPAYRYAPYGYTPREYAPEAYAPGQTYYYPMYDEEGHRFKGFWGDWGSTVEAPMGEVAEEPNAVEELEVKIGTGYLPRGSHWKRSGMIGVYPRSNNENEKFKSVWGGGPGNIFSPKDLGR